MFKLDITFKDGTVDHLEVDNFFEGENSFMFRTEKDGPWFKVPYGSMKWYQSKKVG